MIKRVDEVTKPLEWCYVTKAGDVLDVVLTDSRKRQTIQKIDKDKYICCDTGEVREYNHAETRKDNSQSVYRSLKHLRQLINANVTDRDKVRWVTLTYAENMTDSKRLYEDFRRFWQRFKYYYKGYKIEYILANEPQGRGAWHMHIFFIFDRQAPFIPNKVLADLWGFGFVSVKQIDGNIDNLGAYLSAYLGDMEVPKNKVMEYEQVYDVNNIKVVQGEKCDKYVVKGARLNLYPVGFNIYKCSRGIKQPEKLKVGLKTLKKLVGDATPTYQRNYEISYNADNQEIYQSQLSIIQYNLKRKNKN